MVRIEVKTVKLSQMGEYGLLTNGKIFLSMLMAGLRRRYAIPQADGIKEIDR